jgi:hypothetical protein
VATGGPAPAPAPGPGGDAAGKPESNPFAVFSETQAPPAAPPAAPNPPPGAGPGPGPAAGAAPENPPQGAPPAEAPAPAPAPGDDNALGFLAAAAANRGDPKFFHQPATAAMFFLAAIKKKDLNEIAQATALRAATESKNTKLFQLILAQELAQEDLDELAKKLDKYQFAGQNQPKSSGSIGIIITKPEGTSIMRRTITMRHEKAGWKVLDISGEGEIEKPIIMPRVRGGMGGRRR